jgi:hypothetical protein
VFYPAAHPQGPARGSVFVGGRPGEWGSGRRGREPVVELVGEAGSGTTVVGSAGGIWCAAIPYLSRYVPCDTCRSSQTATFFVPRFLTLAALCLRLASVQERHFGVPRFLTLAARVCGSIRAVAARSTRSRVGVPWVGAEFSLPDAPVRGVRSRARVHGDRSNADCTRATRERPPPVRRRPPRARYADSASSSSTFRITSPWPGQGAAEAVQFQGPATASPSSRFTSR